eukprot:gene3340-3616_t
MAGHVADVDLQQPWPGSSGPAVAAAAAKFGVSAAAVPVAQVPGCGGPKRLAQQAGVHRLLSTALLEEATSAASAGEMVKRVVSDNRVDSDATTAQDAAAGLGAGGVPAWDALLAASATADLVYSSQGSSLNFPGSSLVVELCKHGCSPCLAALLGGALDQMSGAAG